MPTKRIYASNTCNLQHLRGIVLPPLESTKSVQPAPQKDSTMHHQSVAAAQSTSSSYCGPIDSTQSIFFAATSYTPRVNLSTQQSLRSTFFKQSQTESTWCQCNIFKTISTIVFINAMFLLFSILFTYLLIRTVYTDHCTKFYNFPSPLKKYKAKFAHNCY